MCCRTLGLLLLLSVVVLLSSSRIVSATILTFDMSPWPGNSQPIPQTYGDYVNGPSQLVGATTFSYQQGNGFTPNIGVGYSSTVTQSPSSNGMLLWTDGAWPNVLFTRSQQSEPASTANYDITFTPDAGYGVRVNSFKYDAYGVGHTVRWGLYVGSVDPGNLVAGSDVTNVSVPASDLIVNTAMTEFVFDTLILRHTHISGAANSLGLDNINFEQMMAPEPGDTVIWLLFAVVGLAWAGHGAWRRKLPLAVAVVRK